MSAAFLRSLGLVAAGGAAGAAGREGMVLAFPDTGHLPWAIIAANLAGAFALGWLYAALARAEANSVHTLRGSTHRPVAARRLRLLLGTGFCGGFTTYSTLAVGVVLLAGSSGPGWAAAYGLGSVAAGALATWAGLALGTGTSKGADGRSSLAPVDPAGRKL